MNFNVQQVEPARIAYIRGTGPYGEENFAVMAQLKDWAAEHKLFNSEAVILAIAHDDATVTPPAQCRYDACIVVVEGFHPKGRQPVEYGQLPGGSYAVFTLPHTQAAVAAAWQGIFPALEKANLSFDASRPPFERYLGSVEDDAPCDIFVPVLP